MKLLYQILAILLFLPAAVFAQPTTSFIEGEIFEEITETEEYAIVGADVYWSGTTIGTTTNAEGAFRLDRINETKFLVISYVGYRVDTFDVSEDDFVHIHLEPSVTMDEIEVSVRKKSTEVSFLNTAKTELISEQELLKAACCNLSESFETNASVDVSFTDAVTGTRQIQMLGLAGAYSQITNENMPGIRGLSTIYGLSFVPGTWIESIQLNKGAGSVANGFESIAGQINVELRKPETADRIYLNLYGNEGGRIEANANIAHRFKGDKWSTALLLHGQNKSIKWDRNDDGFLDMPLSNQFIGLNRWKFIGDDGIRMQFGIKGTILANTGGQVDFDPDTDKLTTNNWGMNMNTKRIEGWSKIGKVFADKPSRSIGLQMSAMHHDQNSYFGLRTYDATQSGFYGNLMFQDFINTTAHKIRTGASFQFDNYEESFNEMAFSRKEIVPGAYFEYTFNHLDKFNIVAGLRADHLNDFGVFVTPRLHVRYAITESAVLRASVGRGQRTANPIAENIGFLASSRNIQVEGQDLNQFSGLHPEIAWNFGANFSQCFKLKGREGTLSLDYYRTTFVNQAVTNIEYPGTISIDNFEGQSFSNSIQLQLDFEIFKRFDARLAYRYYDVRSEGYIENELKTKPLLAPHRAFLNLAYKTENKWAFDYTISWQSSKRIPETDDFDLGQPISDYSPDFVVMNAQVNKNWNDKFEVYLGGENLLNFTQDNRILGSADPFGSDFDASLIWGPVFGRNIYLGLRYWLK